MAAGLVRTFAAVPDNGTFSGGHFSTTNAWWPWMVNVLHHGEQRLPYVVQEHAMERVLTALIGEVARFYFDATPLDRYYMVRCGFSAEISSDRSFGTIDWEVRTEDTAGAFAATNPTSSDVFRVAPGGGDRLRLAQFAWPRTNYQWMPIVTTQWVRHDPDLTRPSTDLVLIIRAARGNVLVPQDVHLRSVEVVAYRDEV